MTLKKASLTSGNRTIIAVGDVNPCRNLAEVLLNENIAKKRSELLKLFDSADLVLGNLEGPITDSDRLNPGQIWNLKVPPVLGNLLSAFDGFSLANNHIFDFGLEGLTDTFDRLNEFGIKYCGAGKTSQEAGRPALFDLNGFQVSMIGITDRNWHPSGLSSPGAYTWRGQKTEDEIGVLAQNSDFVIVQIHQGYEFLNYPGPEELFAARKAIDAGADLVLGHHSHYLMGVIRRGKGAIAYGLGDFLLDKMHIPEPSREKARQCAVFRFQIAKHEVLDWNITPCITDKYGWPTLADDALASSTRKYFDKLSRILEDEKETLKRFQHQAGENMLPYAFRLLKHLFSREGLSATFLRLSRIRWVDITVMGNYLSRLVRRKV